MPISRKPLKPRAPRKATTVRVAHASPPEPSREPIVTADYKRELIRAHAAMRQPRDPVQMLSVWAGVLASFAVIAGVWWWASSPAILHSWNKPWTEGFEGAIDGAKTLQQTVGQTAAQQATSLSADLDHVSKQLDALDAQHQRSQDSLQRMAQLIQQDASSTGNATTVVSTIPRSLFRSASSTNPTATTTHFQ